MEEGITGSDVGEEGIAEALAFGGALHQAGDVDHVQVGRDFAGKTKHFDKTVLIKIGILHTYNESDTISIQ